MKYKFKIDTPWGKKGDELKDNNIDIMGFWGIQRLKVAPSSYPELFEEIIEKTNLEKWQDVMRIEFNRSWFEFSLFLDKKGYNADAAYNEICDKK